jgi:hypothetical protein
MADPVLRAGNDADAGPEQPVGDHPSHDVPHTHWFFARFASAIGNTYRSMDPFVAQLITAPGLLPADQDVVADA